MPQQILPLIPRGATQINGLVSVWRDTESWTYFLATHPIYSHRKTDQGIYLPQVCRRCQIIFPEVRCPEISKRKENDNSGIFIFTLFNLPQGTLFDSR